MHVMEECELMGPLLPLLNPPPLPPQVLLCGALVMIMLMLMLMPERRVTKQSTVTCHS